MKWLQHLRQTMKSRLTLRVRLALWSAALLFVFSAGLITLINVVTPILSSDPYTATFELFESSEQSSQPLTVQVIEVAPETPSTNNDSNPISLIREEIIHEVRVISLIGLGVVVLLGGAGAYWLAGRALRPVREVSRAAHSIDASTLDTRLAVKGPEDELKQLATSFDAMLDRLERAFEQQERFVADAAHELRTPLTTLRINLDIIRTDPDATLEDYREMSVSLERALTRVQRLVADLILLATEEYPLPDSKVVIEPLVEEVLLDLKPLAEKHQVALKYRGDETLTVHGEAKSLARILGNLVGNGIRYNRPGGEVIVSSYSDGPWGILTVADTGIGIPPEHQVHIFDRFYRVDRSRSRHKGGAGLGLAIVAHLVHLHNGQIQLESAPDIGTTFTVRLPL